MDGCDPVIWTSGMPFRNPEFSQLKQMLLVTKVYLGSPGGFLLKFLY